MSAPLDVTVRAMAREDIPAVLRIEEDSFPHPWSAAQFLEELERDVAHLAVAERPRHGAPEIVAYLSSWWVAGEFHVLNVAVAPAVRRRGVAEQLLRALARRAAVEGGCRQAFLEVRRSNSGAQALYLQLGFAAVGVRPRYYAQENEDAILMSADMDEDGRFCPPPPGVS